MACRAHKAWQVSSSWLAPPSDPGMTLCGWWGFQRGFHRVWTSLTHAQSASPRGGARSSSCSLSDPPGGCYRAWAQLEAYSSWCSPSPSWNSRPAVWCDYQTWLMPAGSGEVDEAALVLVGSRVNSQLKIKQKRWLFINPITQPACIPRSHKPVFREMFQETEENQTRSLPPPQPRVWCFSFVVFADYCAAEGFPSGASGKEPACQCRRCKRCRFAPWVRKVSWRRAWQPTPLFLPGESPWTEEPGGLQSMGSQRVRHDWSDLARTHMQKRLIYRSLITPTVLHVGTVEGPGPWVDPWNGLQQRSPTAGFPLSKNSSIPLREGALCEPAKSDWATSQTC